MPIEIGTDELKAAYVGDDPVSKIYVGDDLVWTSATNPAAPVLTATVVSSSRVDLTWTEPADGGATITGYDVEYKLASALVLTWTDAGHTGTTRTASITGLTRATAYQFRVRAVNAVGHGPRSAVVSATTRAELPGAPVLTATVVSGTRVDLMWTAPDSGGATITGYDVEHKLASASNWMDASHSGTGRTDSITGLDTATAYQFRVRAVNAVGNGPRSAVVSATTTADRLFLIENDRQVWEINRSDPNASTLIGSMAPGGSNNPGSLVILTDGTVIAYMLDSSQPRNPRLVRASSVNSLSSSTFVTGNLPSHAAAMGLLPNGTVIGISDGDLYTIDVSTPANSTSRGDLPSGLGARGLRGLGVDRDGNVYAVTPNDDQLWRINPADPDDVSGVYGFVGRLPSTLTEAQSLSFADGDLYIIDHDGTELWRINPADPDDVSGVYGLVGTLPAGVSSPQGMGVLLA